MSSSPTGINRDDNVAAQRQDILDARDALRRVQTGRVWFEPHSDCLDPIIEAIKALDRLAGYDNVAGLPDDLARVLRDPTVKVPQDEYRMPDGRTLWEHLEEWRNAPSGTASA